jgi:hypothetical protein
VIIIQWIATLGVVGFLCGFFGPMLLAPEANQGPMLGIFISGPGGAALGAILGLVVAALGLPTIIATRFLYAATIIVAASTLYFSVPSPRYRADVIDGEIRQCIPPERLREKAVDRLNEMEAKRPDPRPKAWAEAFDQALTNDRGVVLELYVLRTSRLYEREAVWNRGVMEARPWIAEKQLHMYFASYAGADCVAYPIGVRSLFRATGLLGIWPPAYIAEMLALKVAAPLPARDADLLRDVGGAP